jgi:hypothetical protein
MLETRLAELVQAVGTDIKQLRAGQNVIISDEEPVLDAPGSVVWVNSADDPPTLWLVTAT